MVSPSKLVRRALLLLLLAPPLAALRAQERSVDGAWRVDGQPDLALEVARDGAGLTLSRARGAASAVGRGAVGPTGWLAARFEATPGLAGATSLSPLDLARASEPPAGFGLWEVLAADDLGGPRLRGFFTEPDGERRFEVAVRPGERAPAERGGFARHLREAIALNQARRPLYEARTRGESAALSRRLVLYERLLLPWAWWMDRRARRWNERGVMIVAADFVSMTHVRDAAAAPPRAGRASEARLEALDARLATFRGDVKRACDAGRFDEVARLSVALLREVEDAEAREGCSYAMTRHVVEQVGYAALNAITWRAQSGGETDGLARRFIWGLRLGTSSCVGLDRRAQALHALGAGIIVNDVPDIPLAVAHEAWASRR